MLQAGVPAAVDSDFMSPLPIQPPITEIADLCRRHGIARLSLFGSVLREDFSPSSDIDVLVEFQAGKAPGFIGFAGLQMELSKILGRTVDLRTPADLSGYFRDEVLREARLLHAA
jgi:predicted nucleotidyltransferase